MAKIVGDFQKENPNIKVTFETAQWDVMFNKWVTAFAAGQAPEVVAMHPNEMPEFAAKGMLEPLEPLLPKLGLKAEDFSKPAWEANIFQGKLYAITLDVHMFGLFYNVDMFKKAGIDKPPADKDSLIAAAQKLTLDKNGKNPTDPAFDAKNVVQWGIAMPATHQHAYRYWYSLLYQQGGSFLTPDGKAAAFNTPEGIEAYQFLQDLIFKYKVAPEGEQNIGKDFQEQRVAMVIEGPWNIPAFEKQAGLNWDVAKFPRIYKKDAVWGNSHCIGVTKIPAGRDPAVTDASLKLIRYIIDHADYWAQSGQIPTKLSVVNSEAFKKLPKRAAFVEQMPNVVYLPPLVNQSKIFATNAPTPMMVAMQNIMQGKTTPKEALALMEKQVNDILKQP